jgi:16S rRNA (cytosine967-C5)-methyltransferase
MGRESWSKSHAEVRVPAVSAREIALEVLLSYPGRAKPEDLLEDLLETRDPGRTERALATQIVSGTIKWRRYLDHVIKQLSHKRRVASPVVLNVLRLSLYQLVFLDRVPSYGATNEGVKLAKRFGDRHQAAYVNAILRRFLRERESVTFPDSARDPVGHISTVYSYPPWIVRRWLSRYSQPEVAQLAAAGNRIAATGLRLNALRGTMDDLETALGRDGIEIERRGLWGMNHVYVRGASPVDRLAAFREGLIQVQDASSTLVGHVLDPIPGSIVVDLCSAPGGKATHLYELARGKATVIANDVSPDRLAYVAANAKRLAHGGMLFTVSDGRRPSIAGADFLLVDAPCTGLGVLARRWDLRWTKRERDIARMASYQKELLAAAIDIVKVGGIVVYSTCSIEPEENREVVEAVMAARSDVRASDIRGRVPDEVICGPGMLQTLPHKHGVDGIFAARMERI